MKMLKFLILGLLLTTVYSQAQVSVTVNVGTPPPWGPVGYTEVRYYYLPDIQVYYDIETTNYIYISNGNWIRAKVLPSAYRSYDLYGGYKVVLSDYKGKTPYIYFKDHKVKYPKGYKGKPQKTIGVPPGQAKKAEAKTSSGKENGNSKSKDNSGGGNGKGKG